MTLDVRSLAYAPGVSVFPARSGFTLGRCMSMWVVAHTLVVAVYCFLLCVAVFFAVLHVVVQYSHYIHLN